MAGESGFQISGGAAERYERHVAPIMAPFIPAILDAAALPPGGALLDLACGTGFVARAALPSLDPDGRIVGVDVNPEMLEVAAAHTPADAPDRPTVSWRHASADELPFPAAQFDAVVCQQGAQFFPDLDAALAEATRVLRPGGRIAVATWASIDRSPFFLAQRLAVDDVAGPEVAASFDTAFACSARRLTAGLRTAGLTDVTSREVTCKIRLPRLDEYAPGQLLALPWGRPVATHPDGLTTYTRTLADLLFPYVAPDQSVVVPFATTLATAVRPAGD
ncbi:MAG: methyltransferase domain-containing protein [Streptomycetaceae bacterium]|nr:methyltransferase domain-containing protein [Streptomycetaceae bacterium]